MNSLQISGESETLSSGWLHLAVFVTFIVPLQDDRLLIGSATGAVLLCISLEDKTLALVAEDVQEPCAVPFLITCDWCHLV